jgi:hypothetical protein
LRRAAPLGIEETPPVHKTLGLGDKARKMTINGFVCQMIEKDALSDWQGLLCRTQSPRPLAQLFHENDVPDAISPSAGFLAEALQSTSARWQSFDALYFTVVRRR